MKAYRISGRTPAFDGTGAELYGGRWNSAGRPAVYCGATFAICMLERLVHAGIGEVPATDRWVEIDIPDALVERLDEAALPDWDADDSPSALAFGDRWLSERRSAVLDVPSAVTRIDRNLMINPRHPDFPRIAIGREQPLRWDARLFGSRRAGGGA